MDIPVNPDSVPVPSISHPHPPTQCESPLTAVTLHQPACLHPIGREVCDGSNWSNRASWAMHSVGGRVEPWGLQEQTAGNDGYQRLFLGDNGVEFDSELG